MPTFFVFNHELYHGEINIIAEVVPAAVVDVRVAKGCPADGIRNNERGRNPIGRDDSWII